MSVNSSLADQLRLVLLMSDKDALAALGLSVAEGNGPIPDSFFSSLHFLQKDISELFLAIEQDNYYRRFG